MKKTKKSCLLLLLTALLILTCSLPAWAGYEYGLVYDGTEDMQANTLKQLGETVLPAISQANGVECRVDIVSTLQGYSLPDYAEGLYETYDYGKDYANGGLLLLIYLKPDASGYELGGYQLYYGGTAYADLDDSVAAAMNGRVTEFAWTYDEDLDRAAVNDAVQVYADAIDAYFGSTAGADAAAAAGVAAAADTAADAGDTSAGDTAAAAEAAATSAKLDYVTDDAGLLTPEQWEALNSKAKAISEQYNCGVYIVTVNDYQQFANSVEDCSRGIFNKYELGYGSTKDGVLLLLSMADRDYDLIAHGDFGNAAFTDYGKEQLDAYFLPSFAKDDWYSGFAGYLNGVDEFMAAADAGEPVDTYADEGASEGATKAAKTGVVLGVPTVVAGLVNRVQARKMKSVRRRTNASAYAAPTGLIIHDQQERYTHSTESRHRVVSSSSGGGHRPGGGGTTIGHGGFSGHSGKF